MINEIFKIDTNVRGIIRDAYTGRIKRISDYGSNLIVNSGRNTILDNLRNTTHTNSGVITYGAVGTNDGAAAAAQEALIDEIARAIVVSPASRRTAQTLTLRVYFAPEEATGTLKEFGWFGGGINGNASGVADSGTMYTRIVINETITDSESLSIEQDFTW